MQAGRLRSKVWREESEMERQVMFAGFRSVNVKDEWLTPPEIVNSLGTFDLDPCSPINRPWPTAKRHYTIDDDGLAQTWSGRVWCNPPYGDETAVWRERMANHGNGICLVFARTETQWFHEQVWQKANAILFFRGRIAFYHVTGEQGDSAAAPSVLIAYGENNVLALMSCGLEGFLV